MPWLIGYEREKIPWFPTVDEAKCLSCAMCMNCGKDVFDWRDGKATVARPYNCVVGCSTCAALCLGEAITFQPLGPVREIYRREKIWSKVKRALRDAAKLPAAEHTEVGE